MRRVRGIDICTQIRYKHCIEVIQEFLINQDTTMQSTLLQFQQYVGANIDTLSDSSITQQNIELTKANRHYIDKFDF